MASMVEDGALQGAIEEFADFGDSQSFADAGYRATITVEVCKGCRKERVAFRMSEKSADGLWIGMDDYRVANGTAVPVDISPLKRLRA